jgi:hypothetical protein
VRPAAAPAYVADFMCYSCITVTSADSNACESCIRNSAYNLSIRIQ